MTIRDTEVVPVAFSRFLGFAAEHWINRDIRLFVADRNFHALAIFEQEEIPQEWGRGLPKPTLPERYATQAAAKRSAAERFNQAS